MENKLEEKLKIGHNEYLKLPKAECSGVNRESELYSNHWCVITGRAIIHPHPHRYYTFVEFVYWCGKDQTLYDRFIKDISLKDHNKGKIATRNIYVLDQGHYGFTTCSLCGCKLNDDKWDNECQECGATLEGMNVDCNMGGSDF